jgi:hypothetical protein
MLLHSKGKIIKVMLNIVVSLISIGKIRKRPLWNCELRDLGIEELKKLFVVIQ